MTQSDKVWMIYFEDSEMRPEVFIGEEAERCARDRFKQLIIAWNCHLFVKVQSG